MSIQCGTEISIVQARRVADYRLELTFSDGAVRTVDFGPFLRESKHPEIRAFLEPTRFAGFELRHGELVWGDYELCFPIADLYEGSL